MAGPNVFTKMLDKIRPSKGSASDDELRQRELTRERINSMSDEQKSRIQKETQTRSSEIGRGGGGVGLVQ